MKTFDILLIIILIVIFNIPTDSNSIVAESIDLSLSEGIVAVVYNIDDTTTPTPSPTPIPIIDCDCNGTKQVKSPDGLVNIPCPCDNCTCNQNMPKPSPEHKCNCGCTIPNCKCSRSQKTEVVQVEEVKEEEIHIMNRQMLYFHAKWCGPCKKFDSEQVPELKRRNWGVDTNKHSYIKKLDYDKFPELVKKYNVEAIPVFILLKDGVEIDRLVGYHTAAQVTQMWTKHFK